MDEALDNILRLYLHQELINGGYTDHNNERGHAHKARGRVRHKDARKPKDKLPDPQPQHGTSIQDENDEIIPNLIACLEEKGILREVQAFLRQKLVSVLQGTCPQLFEESKRELNPTVVSLVRDFLCSRKLLFSLSVLSSELGKEYFQRGNQLTKLKSLEAENLLEKLEIKQNTKLSRKTLHSYSHTENMSLLECILQEGGFEVIGKIGNIDEHDMKKYSKLLTLDERLKKIDEKYANEMVGKSNQALSVDQRFRQLALSLERDKQLQLKMEIEKFKEEELSKIREQIETELKFELIKKEKELLENYEEKVNHFKLNFEREKEMWLNEKNHKEREILERRDELIEAIQSLHQERINHEKLNLIESGSLNRIGSGNGIDQVSNVIKERDLETEKREADRMFWLNEARLQNAKERERLDEANFTNIKKSNVASKSTKPKLVREACISSTDAESPIRLPQRSRKKQSKAFGFDEIERDRVALLQYQLEKQAEELEELRKLTKDQVQKPSTRLSESSIGAGTVNDLDNFLADSMKRISAIDREADTVGKMLSSYNRKKERLEKVREELDKEAPGHKYFDKSNEMLPMPLKIDGLPNRNFDSAKDHKPKQIRIQEQEVTNCDTPTRKQCIEIPLYSELATLDYESAIIKPPNKVLPVSKPEAGGAGDFTELQFNNTQIPPPPGSLFLTSILDTNKPEPRQKMQSTQLQVQEGSLILTDDCDKDIQLEKPAQSFEISQVPQYGHGSLYLSSLLGSEEKKEEKIVTKNINPIESLGKELHDTNQEEIIANEVPKPPENNSLPSKSSSESERNLVKKASTSGALMKNKLRIDISSEIQDETISSSESTKNSTTSEFSLKLKPEPKEKSKNELDKLLDGIGKNSQLAKFIKVSYEDIKAFEEGVIEKENVSGAGDDKTTADDEMFW